MASRPEFAGAWSQAGGVARQELGGMWWASVPRERWPQDDESLKFIRANWMDGVGDARQELVFIGMNMDESALRARLGSALLTDEEMAEGPGEWRHYSDPFAPWVAA
ncbi:Cobalamin synthesis protein cobW C-terminal domain [Raoultella ornithinolytica]|nr:Cobalamin synthesis protein cobW C-terminal domain [Raoultella ornithinolytica]